jgi:hypothetical protein
MDRSEAPGMHPAVFAALVLLALLIGGFSLFVGYHKAFSPLDVLVQNSAWTVHLPVWLGRAVGWAELAAAVTLFAGLPLRRFARAGYFAAIWITLNHAVAAVVHVIHAEWHTLTQSAVVITLCVVMVALYRRRQA